MDLTKVPERNKEIISPWWLSISSWRHFMVGMTFYFVSTNFITPKRDTKSYLVKKTYLVKTGKISSWREKIIVMTKWKVVMTRFKWSKQNYKVVLRETLPSPYFILSLLAFRTGNIITNLGYFYYIYGSYRQWVVKMTTFSKAIHENFVKMTNLFQYGPFNIR